MQYYGSVAAASDDAEMAPAGRYWSSMCTYKFERIVGDEAHTLRNPRTLISEGMKQTQTLSKTWLTATPILNHPKDLRGMLAQMWTPNWALHNVGLGFLECYQEAFNPRAFEHTVAGETRLVSFLPPNTEEHKEKYHAYQAALQNNDKIWLLDPDNYKICGSREDWSPYATNLIIPPILKMVMLRMTAASHIDLGDGKPPRRVGEDVPPCSIYAIELQMDRDEARLYNDATHHLYKHLFIGDTDMIEGLQCTTQPSVQGKNSDSPEGIQDAGVHRFIMHSTLDPRLASLTLRNHKDMTKEQKRAAAKTKRNNWVDVDFDHGASFYYAKTRHGREYAIPADRLSLATYMCAKSVKIREILYLLSEWVLKLQEKVILVFEFPMSQW